MAASPPPTYDFGVVGLGRMGASIAGSLALRGCKVAMFDKSNFDREKGWNIMSADLKDHVDQGMITQADKDLALSRAKLVETLDAVADSVVVVEAIFEDLNAKRELFANLEKAANQKHSGTVFSSNSMNFDVTDIARGVVSSERPICGLRFLHPVFFMPEIEVSGPWAIPPQSCQELMALLRRLEFKPFFYNLRNTPSGFLRRRLDLNEVNRYRQEQKARTARVIAAGPEANPQPTSATKPRSAASSECMICLDAVANALFAPCGHQTMCMRCARNWWQSPERQPHNCPVCRVHVERLLEAA